MMIFFIKMDVKEKLSQVRTNVPFLHLNSGYDLDHKIKFTFHQDLAESGDNRKIFIKERCGDFQQIPSAPQHVRAL